MIIFTGTCQGLVCSETWTALLLMLWRNIRIASTIITVLVVFTAHSREQYGMGEEQFLVSALKTRLKISSSSIILKMFRSASPGPIRLSKKNILMTPSAIWSCTLLTMARIRFLLIRRSWKVILERTIQILNSFHLQQRESQIPKSSIQSLTKTILWSFLIMTWIITKTYSNSSNPWQTE